MASQLHNYGYASHAVNQTSYSIQIFNGMLIYYRNKPIKHVPEKYACIPDLTDYLDEFNSTRLSKTERAALDQALFEYHASRFLQQLKQTDPLAWEHVKDSTPVMVYQVNTNDNQTYYSLKLKNGLSVRCDQSLYHLSPIRGRRRYATSFNNN